MALDPVSQWYLAAATVDGENGRIAFKSSPTLATMARTTSAKDASLHILSFVLTGKTCDEQDVQTFWRTISGYAIAQQRTSLVMVINPYPTDQSLRPKGVLRTYHVPGFYVPRASSDKEWFVEFFIVNMPHTDELIIGTHMGRNTSELREWMGDVDG